MKTKKLLNYGFLFLILLFIASCEKEIETEYQDAYPISGTWWVTYKFDDGSGTIDDWYGVGYTKLFIYNTSLEKDMVFIEDHGNFWDFKVKAKYSGETFSITNGYDYQHDDTTTIAKGKIINKDSIYMEITWASDPTTVYYCTGRRYDGFGE